MSASTLTAGSAWRDRKRPLWSLGAPVLLLPVIGDLLARASGLSLFYWMPMLFLYGVIPLLDWLIGSDRSNPPAAAVPALEADRYYRRAVYAAVPLQYFAFVYGCWVAVDQPLHGLAWLGMALGVGTVSGVGINTAHELGHKTAPLERWLAKIALAPVAYGHFYVEHNRGHHVRVATPEDPASARYGESFYRFLPRTMWGSLVSACRLERARLARRGQPFWHPANELLQAWAMTALVWGALLAWLGWAALPFLLLQAFYGASLLEVVNYLEHYGLCRREVAPGRYERCQPRHSWNSNHVVTNLLLYQLQRHSDHHANPTRSYQALRHFDESPQLPSGYASMILLAYLPPVWFRVMNPRVAAHYVGDLAQANRGPRRRRSAA
jgi:alkane 1-monooxygenase (EC 1.14.15.3)